MDKSRSPRQQSKTPQKGPRLPPPQPSNRLYVAFLPSQIEENQLNTMFSKCGNVSQVSLKRKDDGFTFGYVTLDTVEQAQKGIEQWNKTKMGQKSLMVKFANPIPQKDQSKGGFKGKRGFGQRPSRGGFGFKRDNMNNKKFQKSSFNPRDKPFNRGNDAKDYSGERGGQKTRGYNANFKSRNQGFEMKRDFKGGNRGGFNGKGRYDNQKRRNEDDKTEYGEDSKIPKLSQV